MDLQTRKIAFVQKILKIQNEEVISRLEEMLGSEISTSDDGDFEPMTIEEFNARIDNSMEDSKEGRLIEASDLKSSIEKWR